jgi:hypothetical protein
MSKKPTEKQAAPQITFTEQDVQKMRDFGSFLLSHAKFNLSIPEAVKLNGFVGFMNQLSQKMEAHILELKSITKPEKTDANNSGV